ncbi:uncharacterized protein LY79DRAFT_97623 [Colletotrichum navitas]|uniref:Uncharacterized protein n=1 Tax=Colletotrichum navitas TaxID=681940 RepID=A0AAD8PK76_9PEZI|nr:uncharacterized protein LY79DRAFT_97623 [Colletotrichum navitas]KAK1566293.1 hypothetical protein LY79DRAFT_97623 [Colletotrichum navitas]
MAKTMQHFLGEPLAHLSAASVATPTPRARHQRMSLWFLLVFTRPSWRCRPSQPLPRRSTAVLGSPQAPRDAPTANSELQHWRERQDRLGMGHLQSLIATFRDWKAVDSVLGHSRCAETV